MIETTINGREVEIAAHYDDETLIEYLRGRGQLTGAKLACGAGVCGACTVLVNGRPVASCLLPLTHAAGKQVQTVEFHGPDNLHPVQRAFMMNDALQCGFCTPGFINSAIAFYERWRRDHGLGRPEREEIAQALAGNLCRCGAYPAIYEAVAQACAGDFDRESAVRPPRHEALDKVTGQAKYTVDQRHEDQLEGAILRSEHPHARVIAIDASEALTLPGVFAFSELLAGDRLARFAGQPIGAIAAVDRRTAWQALARVKVTYEVYSAAVGPERAQEEDAPEVFSGFGLLRSPPNASEGAVMPGRWRGNVRKNIFSFTADKSGKARKAIDRARRESDPGLLELHTKNSIQVHTALEPHACLAKWLDDQRLSVHLSTQGVLASAHLIAEHFDLEERNVQLTAEHVGGGFGGKQGITDEVMAAVTLAREAGRPVRVVYDRLEEMSYAAFRPGAESRFAAMTGQGGSISLYTVDSYFDSGIAIGSGVSRLVGFFGPDVPRQTIDREVVNHGPPGKPFRGPDGPQALWVVERAADEAAERWGIDPIEVRRRWYPGDVIRDMLLDWAANLPVWSGRDQMREQGRERPGARFWRGVGLALGAWPFLYSGRSEVAVGVDSSGIFVRTGTQDIGTGTRSVLAGAVAGVFGISPGQVLVDIGHTETPFGPVSGGSRVANTVYGPAVAAAERLRDELVKISADKLGLSGVEPIAGGLRHAQGSISWSELVAQIGPLSTKEVRGSEPAYSRLFELVNRDVHFPSMGIGLSRSITVTEVEVDSRLGRVRPLGVWMAVAAGKIFTPVLARSQVEGGIVQGLGYALYEERQLDLNSGYMVNANLEDYLIPGMGDVPPVEVHFIEEGFEQVRGKGVGIGELATVGVAASVGNAVRHATGWRPVKTPILPADILQGVGQ